MSKLDDDIKTTIGRLYIEGDHAASHVLCEALAEIERLRSASVGANVGVEAATLARVEAVAADLEYKGRHSRSYGHHCMAYEIAGRKLREALAPVGVNVGVESAPVCENCAGQRHTDSSTTFCSACGGLGTAWPEHRAFMAPLAAWANGLAGRPVSTADLAALVQICAGIVAAKAPPEVGVNVGVSDPEPALPSDTSMS